MRIMRIREITRMAPLPVYCSIGLSIHFFGKRLLFDLDLQPLRPLMMSVFPQVPAVGVLEHVLGGLRGVRPGGRLESE